MIADPPFSQFHQWLLNEPPPGLKPRAIVLHGAATEFIEGLIEGIAAYLNEFDDEGAGRWLPATAPLVVGISGNANLRRLLGMQDSCPNCPPTGPCGIRKTLAALGKRGHVIFRSIPPPDKEPDIPNAFHAAICGGDALIRKCHLVLNPDLMDRECIIHVIGDVFLECIHQPPASREMQ